MSTLPPLPAGPGAFLASDPSTLQFAEVLLFFEAVVKMRTSGVMKPLSFSCSPSMVSRAVAKYLVGYRSQKGQSGAACKLLAGTVAALGCLHLGNVTHTVPAALLGLSVVLLHFGSSEQL